MFGLIISGRPVDAAPQAISEAQYAFQITPASSFSHIVVFLLPGTQLPPDTAASVYIQIPPSQEFKLLGGIGPGKESAIFRLSGLKSSNHTDGDMDAMSDGATIAGATGNIVVGVSVEPAAQVEQQLVALQSGRAQQPRPGTMIRFSSSSGGRIDTKGLAQRIIANAFNFLASFGSDTVPLKAFQDWWTKFEKKVDLDPSFLEREEQG